MRIPRAVFCHKLVSSMKIAAVRIFDILSFLEQDIFQAFVVVSCEWVIVPMTV